MPHGMAGKRQNKNVHADGKTVTAAENSMPHRMAGMLRDKNVHAVGKTVTGAGKTVRAAGKTVTARHGRHAAVQKRCMRLEKR